VTQRANEGATKRSAKVDLEYFGLCTLEFSITLIRTIHNVTQRWNQGATMQCAKVDFVYFGLRPLYIGLSTLNFELCTLDSERDSASESTSDYAMC
jgi:hypothetical protein